MRKSIVVVLLVVLGGSAFAQQDTIANPNSIDKIPFYEQLYRFRVWRNVNLREKQNAGFKSAKSDIGDFLIKVIKNGSLIAYDGDSVRAAYKPEDVLVLNTAVQAPAYNSQQNYTTTEEVSYQGKNYASTRNDNIGHLPTDNQWWELTQNQTELLTAGQIAELQIVEDVIFDKRRSRLYYDIQYIGIIVEKDGQYNPKGFIYYKDFVKLVDKGAHSKNLDERDKVQWRNRYNPSENKSFIDAFKLRLFHGIIEKVENPDDRTIQAIYENNGRTFGESVFARWEEEMKLMEKEHNLWEY
ncbi:MAG: gliding motility protein GldN [Flammeovirgaceae bacterium]